MVCVFVPYNVLKGFNQDLFILVEEQCEIQL